MKKLLFIILFLISLGVSSQSKIWTLPPNRVDFSTIPAISVSLPGSVTSSYYTSNGAFNSQGNLLFYVKDLVVYNAVGTVLGNLSFYSYSDPNCGGQRSYNYPQRETAIVPVPNALNQYYIIWIGAPNCPLASGVTVRYAIVTVNTQANPYTYTFVNQSQSYTALLTATGGTTSGLAVGKLLQDNTRKMYVVTNNAVGIFTIGGSQVTLTSTVTFSTPTVSNSPTDVELSPDGLKLAWGDRSLSQVRHVNLDATNGTFIQGAVQTSVFSTAAGGYARGVEFGVNNQLYAVSIGNLYKIDSPGSGTTFTNLLSNNLLGKSHLELANNGLAYTISTSGKLTNIDLALLNVMESPDIQYSNANWPSGTDFYGLPDQIDNIRENLSLCLKTSNNNLIKNPGFEEYQAGWDNFWSHDNNGTYVQTSSLINTDYVLCGMNALKINYAGTQDWSLSTSYLIPVVPGQTYHYSANFEAERIDGNLSIGIISYNQNQTVVNWFLSTTNINVTSSYSEYSADFTIPAGVYFIQPRIVGWGTAKFYADNFSLYSSSCLTLDSQPSLLINPGFESGRTGWDNLWLQETNSYTDAGTLISNTFTYCGNNSIKINYQGTRQWSIPRSDFTPVLPGQSYTLKAYIKADVISIASLGVVAYDGSKVVTNWFLGNYSIALSSNGSFVEYKIDFTIPDGTYFINPRLVGEGNTTLYADNFILYSSNCTASQVLNGQPNLLSNPGFESGKTNWTDFWKRDNNGSYIDLNSMILSENVNCGNKAVKINYQGSLDWSLTRSDFIPVAQSNSYTLTAYIKGTSANASLQVVGYDVGKTTPVFTLPSQIINSTNSNFTKYQITFSIPANISYIVPRIVGVGNTVLYVDDFGLYNNGCNESSSNSNTNIIMNPGFEDGLNKWYNIDNVLSFTASANFAKCGNKSLKVLQPASSGWRTLLTYNAIPVKPGQIYEYSLSAFFNSGFANAHMSVATYGQGTIDYPNNIWTGIHTWNFVDKEILVNQGIWQEQKVSFIIPSGVTYIVPRVQFYDINDLYIDNVKLSLVDQVNPSAQLSITNSNLTIKSLLNTAQFQFTKGPDIYLTESTQDIIFTKGRIENSTIILDGIYQKSNENVRVEVSAYDDKAAKFIIKSNLLSRFPDEILRFPKIINSKDGQSLIIPYQTGIKWPVKQLNIFGTTYNFWAGKMTMPIFGVVNQSGTTGSGYLIASADPWDTGIGLIGDGITTNYSPQIQHFQTLGKIGYDRTFYYAFENTEGYNGLAKWYRNYKKNQEEFKDFNTKKLTNPNISKLIGAAEFWIKESHHFDNGFRSPLWIDLMYNYGVDKAMIQVGGVDQLFSSGTNVSGSPGSCSLTLNPSLSYETITQNPGVSSSVSPLLNEIFFKGLLGGRYELHAGVTDGQVYTSNTYPLADCNFCNKAYRRVGFQTDIIHNSNGINLLGQESLDNGPDDCGALSYYTCSSTYLKYATDWLIDDKLKNPNLTARFIDVITAIDLKECYNTNHIPNLHSTPIGRKESGAFNKAVLNFESAHGQVTGSEEAQDFTFTGVDWGDGPMSLFFPSDPHEPTGVGWRNGGDPGQTYLDYNLNPSIRIPLHGLVYHDAHTISWHWNDHLMVLDEYTGPYGNTKKIWDKKDLFTILYGVMPMICPTDNAGDISKDTWTNPDPTNTWNKKFSKVMTTYHLTSAAFRSTGWSAMTKHEILSSGDATVQQTTFENGIKVKVNFSETSVQNGLPFLGFDITNSDNVSIAYKKSMADDSTGAARVVAATEYCDNGNYRYFLNPYSSSLSDFFTKRGISTCIPVYLNKKQSENFINLAIINCPINGTLNTDISIKINPGALPWKMLTNGFVLKIVNSDGTLSDVHTPPTTEGSYLKYSLKTNESFYRIEGTFGSGAVSCVLNRTDNYDQNEKSTFESNAEKNVRISPNPSDGSFVITIGRKDCKKIEIKDSYGKVITSIDQVLSENDFEMNNLSSGVYFVQFHWDTEITTQRVVITR